MQCSYLEVPDVLEGAVVLVDGVVLVVDPVEVVRVRPERLVVAVLRRDDAGEAVEHEEAEDELAAAAGRAHGGGGRGRGGGRHLTRRHGVT